MIAPPNMAHGSPQHWPYAAPLQTLIPQPPTKRPRYYVPAPSPALQLQEVESKLSDLRQIMCALHTQRNALQPIARLPLEVLSSIFHLVALTEEPYPRTRPYPPLYGSPGSLGWILLSHVCRSWRAVALRDPALWASSVCAMPTATAEFLRRARTAPLTIRHDFGRYRHKSRVLQAVLLALEHLPRTRELRIRANKRIIERLADVLHDSPAPALESLELALAADARIGFFYETVRLPERLLTASPCLRRLVLENCRLPWDSELLRNLTHLEVRLVVFSVPDLMLPTITQLLTVLTRCPELHTLVLIDSLPEILDDTPPKPAPHPVHLPALTRLTLAGKPLACANLVQNLRFPSTATLELTCTGLGSLDELRTTVGPLLRSHTGAELRRLSVSASMSDIAVHGDGAGARTLRAAVELNCLRASFPPIACVQPICEGLDLQSVRVLALDVSEGQTLQPTEWRAVLDLMPKIGQLRLCGPGGYEVLQGLSVPEDESGKMGLPLEGLRSLQLNGLCLNFAPSDSEEDLFAVLLRCLEVRKSCGIGLAEVGVERCTGDWEQVQRLKRAVKSVSWDGDEEGVKCDDEGTEVDAGSDTDLEDDRGICDEEYEDEGCGEELSMFWI